MLIASYSNSLGEKMTIETVDEGWGVGQLMLAIHDDPEIFTATLLDQKLADFLRAQLNILFPLPSPCQQKGYKIGDTFHLTRDWGDLNKGELLTLTFDGNDDMPLFYAAKSEIHSCLPLKIVRPTIPASAKGDQS